MNIVMLIFIGIVFMGAGLLFIIKPEYIAMIDGFKIKPCNNREYHRYIKLTGLGIVGAIIIIILVEISAFIFNIEWLHIVYR